MKQNNNRSFGILLFLFFMVISLWPLLSKNEPRMWSLVIAIIFLVLVIFNPKLLSPLTKLWIKLGEIIGKFISPIIIGLIFFLILTPIGLLMKMFKKDLLNLKFSKNDTYWVKRKTKLNSMDKQY